MKTKKIICLFIFCLWSSFSKAEIFSEDGLKSLLSYGYLNSKSMVENFLGFSYKKRILAQFDPLRFVVKRNGQSSVCLSSDFFCDHESLAQGGLRYQLSKDERPVKIQEISLPVYSQIPIDLFRDNVKVYDFQKLIFDYPCEIITNQNQLVRQLWKVIKRQIVMKNSHLKHQNYIDSIIHFILASRTQTFDQETLAAIINRSMQAAQGDIDMVALQNSKRQVSIYVNKHSVKAENKIIFKLGNGVGNPPVGEEIGRLEAIRTMVFPLDCLKISDERVLIRAL